MGALQYVNVNGYAALLLRRTYADLALPGALMDRAKDWLMPHIDKLRWSEKDKTWHFPSGATITFGYLETENDKYRYQGSEFQFVGFDETTQFSETQYQYLFSRLRKPKWLQVPLRMRGASNPGGLGHEWVRQRFLIEGKKHGRIFIPARLADNPHLDEEQYRMSLAQLDPLTRAQLEHGDWEVRPDGKKFRREWFSIVDSYPSDAKRVRYWDLAATEAKPGKDPDWTVGALVAEKDGQYWIIDVKRIRATPQGVEQLILQTAMMDGKGVDIYMEQEPGSSGVNTIDHYRRIVLKGFAFYGHKSTGNKEVRANPVSSTAEAGNVKLIRGIWINEFLDEIVMFPTIGVHDDQVDAISGAIEKLTHTPYRGLFDYINMRKEDNDGETTTATQSHVANHIGNGNHERMVSHA